MTFDEQLALASDLSDGFNGRAVALAKDSSIVVDVIEPPGPTWEEVTKAVEAFIGRSPNAGGYSTEMKEGALVIHSPDPVAGASSDRRRGLPENLKQCPFCSFVTPYDELYTVHVRSHGFT